MKDEVSGMDTATIVRMRRRRRLLFGAASIVVVALAFLTWHTLSTPGQAQHSIPSVRQAESWCLDQVAGNAGQLLPTHDSRTDIVGIKRLRPLNGSPVGETLIVLKNGPAESGYYCSLDDADRAAESGPVATAISPGRTFSYELIYMGSTRTIGYFGFAARVMPEATTVKIVTSQGTVAKLKPTGGLVACIVQAPMRSGDPRLSGVLVSFDSSGEVVGSGSFPFT